MRTRPVSRLAMAQYQMRFFGVTTKLEKMAMTMRTPYKTLFNRFTGFDHVYVPTPDGRACILNKGLPAVHLIPAGEIQVMGMQEGEGKQNTSTSGVFIHTGGWVFVHP